ncbi:MAG: hypothetical protein KDB63_22790 [Nocardioidaceae bacterium]|nr:hypothetical protein [Nocardioidaceae bacterium]
MSDDKKAKPVFEERLHNIRVSVWENRDRNGNVFHNVRIVRRYKSGDDWADADSLTGLGDLALAAEAITLAKAWLRERTLNGSAE